MASPAALAAMEAAFGKGKGPMDMEAAFGKGMGPVDMEAAFAKGMGPADMEAAFKGKGMADMEAAFGKGKGMAEMEAAFANADMEAAFGKGKGMAEMEAAFENADMEAAFNAEQTAQDWAQEFSSSADWAKEMETQSQLASARQMVRRACGARCRYFFRSLGTWEHDPRPAGCPPFAGGEVLLDFTRVADGGLPAREWFVQMANASHPLSATILPEERATDA